MMWHARIAIQATRGAEEGRVALDLGGGGGGLNVRMSSRGYLEVWYVNALRDQL